MKLGDVVELRAIDGTVYVLYIVTKDKKEL